MFAKHLSNDIWHNGIAGEPEKSSRVPTTYAKDKGQIIIYVRDHAIVGGCRSKNTPVLTNHCLRDATQNFDSSLQNVWRYLLRVAFSFDNIIWKTI